MTILRDTFNLMYWLLLLLSGIAKCVFFRYICGTHTKRNISQPGYQMSTLVIMFTKLPLIEDLKRNLGAEPPQTMN